MESELLELVGQPLLLNIPVGMLGGSIVILLVFSALISGSEIAFFSLTDNDVKKLEEEDTPLGRRILYLLNQPRKLLATILISNNFINIGIVIISSFIIPKELTQNWYLNFFINVVIVTFLLVLFGEISPKVYANRYNIKLAKFMANPLNFLSIIFYLPNTILVSGGKWLEKKFAHRISQSHSREDIDEAIDLAVSQEDGSSQDADILKSIVKFGDVPVKQIMRPRVDVIAVDVETSYKELLEIIKNSGYSRIPVFENDFDKVIGILYVKDLIGYLKEKEDFNWQELTRKDTLFVPEAKKTDDLLKQFQVEHKHMAIIVDEYGGSAGIVTLEDILEEIIGDIRDEFDDEPDVEYVKIDEYTYEFEGKTLINDFARVIGVDNVIFEEVRGDSDSLAGMILEITGKFPLKNQIISYQEYHFKITAVSKRRIEKVLVTLPKPSVSDFK